MENLVDLGNKQKNKDKKISTILICFISFFVVVGCILLGKDGWDIAYDKVQNDNKQYTEFYNSLARDALNNGNYLEAHYIYDLKNYEDDDDEIEFLLYYYSRVKENLINSFESGINSDKDEIDDSIVDFYNEYNYLKKYRSDIKYLDDIDSDVIELLNAFYREFPIEKIEEYKETNIW